MVRLGAWLSIVAITAMQLPWVRCVAECHDLVHLSFEECPDDPAPRGGNTRDHEDADHESPGWDVAARTAHRVPLVERTAAAVPGTHGCVRASVPPATAAPRLQASEPLLARTTVVLRV